MKDESNSKTFDKIEYKEVILLLLDSYSLKFCVARINPINLNEKYI